MLMARKKIPTNLALDPVILSEIEDWIAAQEMSVTKTWVFEKALKEFLERRAKKEN